MSVAIGSRRLSVCVVSRAVVRSFAAAMMIWFLVVEGMRSLWGNHLIVSQIRVDDILGVQMLKHR